MPTTGLRERKKQQTRQALRSAALRLTAEHGLERVTVEDIAAAADVSPRTFFNYFPTKEEALIGADPDWIAHILAAVAARPVGEQPLFTLQAVFEEIAVLMADTRDQLVLRRQVIADNPTLSAGHVAAFVAFERVLVDAVRQRGAGDAAASAEAALVVAVAVTAMRVCADQWVEDQAETDLPTLLHAAINRLALGFGPASARPGAPSRGPARKTLRKDPR